MIRKTITYGGTLLVAAALVFLTAGPSQAAPRGGGGHGGGGGFHAGGGGFHSGGFHSGGFHSGGFHTGGFHTGGFHTGGFHSGGFRPYHHHYGRFGGYGYYPYYSGYYPYSLGDYPYSYDSYPYSSGYSPDYSSDPGPGSTYYPGYSSYSSPASPAQADTPAQVTAKVPADAELWFDGTETTRTTLTGAVREFHTPPLTPGTQYTYDVRARWHENGREVTQTQKVLVSAGAHVRVDFPVPTATTEQAPMATAR